MEESTPVLIIKLNICANKVSILTDEETITLILIGKVRCQRNDRHLSACGAGTHSCPECQSSTLDGIMEAPCLHSTQSEGRETEGPQKLSNFSMCNVGRVSLKSFFFFFNLLF